MLYFEILIWRENYIATNTYDEYQVLKSLETWKRWKVATVQNVHEITTKRSAYDKVFTLH